VDVGGSWDQAEIEPYRDLIKAQVAQAVMVGHISNPAMSEEPGLPASLSNRTIREVLRGNLGFNGVVISDDLEMGAIRARYSLEESAVKALKAGNDMIILSNQNAPAPDLPERIVAAIRKAVEAGVLSREDLQASYDRVLALKQRLPGASAKAGAASKRASAERSKATPAR
jgi:beta-N-acetylhexosaminidase